MTVVSPIAGVQSRVAAIRNRLGVAPGATATGGASIETGNAYGPGGNFDPFGEAYQQALSTATMPSQPALQTESTADLTVARRVRSSAAVGGPTGMASAGGTSRTALSGEQVAHLAHNAGFRGEDLVKVVAISQRESGWKPSAFNGNSGTGDRSYGLMQINMIGSLGPARLAQFGLSSEEQLLDPQTNMNAAFAMYSASGNSLNAWGGYKGMSNTFGTDLAAAQQVVIDAHLGG